MFLCKWLKMISGNLVPRVLWEEESKRREHGNEVA